MRTKIILAAATALTFCLSPNVRAENLDEIFAAEKVKPLSREVQALTKKAVSGNAKAQFALAQVYEKGGKTVRRDVATAMSWYEEAARNGNKAALKRMRTLGAVE